MALYDPKIAHFSSTDSYWSLQGVVAGTAEQSQSNPVNVGCAVATMTMSRVVPTGLREDLAMIDFHIAKVSSADRETPSVSDLATLDPFLNTYATTIATIMSSQWKWVETIWHLRNAAAVKDGPAVKRTSLNITGAVGSARIPDQLAATMTIATASRKHWGRVYLGGLAQGTIDTTYGHISSSTLTAIGNAGNALAVSIDGAGFALGVWSRPGLGFLDVYGIHVDDVWDVQRRRRAKQRNAINVHGN